MTTLAMFVEGTFIPSREGATRRFCGLARYLSRCGLSVTVLHCYRGWSDMRLIANEPFRTYFIPPARYYSDLNLLEGILRHESVTVATVSDYETMLTLGVPLKRRLPALRVVFEVHDVASDFNRSLGRTANIDKVAQDETQAFIAADAVLCFTRRDEQSIRGMIVRMSALQARNASTTEDTQARVHWTPFGTELSRDAHTLNSAEPPTLLFLGNLYHEPNSRAVSWIAERLYPDIRERSPDITILIAGDAPPDVRARCSSPGLRFLGMVDDLTEVFAHTTLALCPVLHGSGIKVKVLEYAAVGLPILCTKSALEGIAMLDTHYRAFAVEDDIGQYPERIAGLLANTTELQQLSAASRDVAALQEWSRIALPTATLYEHCAASVPKALNSEWHAPTHTLTPYFLEDNFCKQRFSNVAYSTVTEVLVGGWGDLAAIHA